MLDSNLCIRIVRDRMPGLRVRFKAETDTMCISTVVLYELLYGAGKSATPLKSRSDVERLTARLDVLPLDDDAAAHSADIRVTLEREGRTIGPYDLLIAGQARSRGLIVVTGNLGEFSRIAGLRCEDWLADAPPPKAS